VADGLTIASLFLSAAALAASIYVLGFAIYGVRLRRKSRALPAPAKWPSFLVLVPAHNESAGIAATIQSIRNAVYPAHKLRIVTIADNCTDTTADVARASGSEVWIRTDPSHPGKGQALAWAFQQARGDSFDFAAIIDADTVVEPAFFSEMAAQAQADQVKYPAAVYQGRYEFAASDNTGNKWFESFTLASKAAENTFIYLPRSSVGLVNLLQGNGFCISNAALLKVPFEVGSVVEDAEYALALAKAGVPVRFVERARVKARMTATVRDATPQRLRWASGIFRLFGEVPRLLTTGIRRRSWRLIEAALMLLLASRVILVSLTFGALLVAVLLSATSGGQLTLGLASLAVALQLAYLVLMFRKSGDRPYSMAGLAWAPFYWLFISFVQLAALAGFGRKRWTRTVR
jgi:cellulose synthase/poly-beta-1,6-N-acetylglucosamine synthase-like glycosyltransferase